MMKRLGILIMTLALAAPFALPAGGTEEQAAVGEDEWAEYEVFMFTRFENLWMNNPGDVVTPYVEEKFKLRISDLQWQGEMTAQQRIAQYAATGSWPDVFIGDPNFLQLMLKQDEHMDLTELVPRYMPTYWNEVMTDVDKQLNYGMSGGDGKIAFIYKHSLHPFDPAKDDDPYTVFNRSSHALQTREDLLTAAGYSFKPMAEIVAEAQRTGKPPSRADFALDPPIDTPEQLTEYLRKIKAMNLTMNNAPVYPITWDWSMFHIGTMYDWGHWKYNFETRTADGYLGSPGAKEWFWLVNRWYREGLVDPDFLVDKKAQIRQKYAGGRIGTFFDVYDLPGTIRALQALDSSYVMRPIPMVEADPSNHGYWDAYVPGWFDVVLSADLDESIAIRLLQMWDWMYTREGMEILTWGPPDSGLWELRDGVKVFTDPAVWEAGRTMSEGQGGPEEYGLQALRGHTEGDMWSRIANASAGPQAARFFPSSIQRSYPLDINDTLVYNAGKVLTGFSHHRPLRGNVSYGVGEVVGKTSDYYWGDFRTGLNQDLTSLLNAETRQEYDAAWEDVFSRFKRTTRYDEAQQIMTEYFQSYLE